MIIINCCLHLHLLALFQFSTTFSSISTTQNFYWVINLARRHCLLYNINPFVAGDKFWVHGDIKLVKLVYSSKTKNKTAF